MGNEPKPKIDVSEGDFPGVTMAAVNALIAANSPPRLFRQAAQYVRIESDENGRAIVVRANREVMRREMAEAAHWIKSASKNQRSIAPPKEVVENVLATPELNFPPLRGLSAAPYFNRFGEFVTEDGYDASSGVVLLREKTLRVPKVPDSPSPSDVQAAIASVDELYFDFPFATSSDRCHTFALLLAVIVREMVVGPLPLYFIDAPSIGTGKTLLARCSLLVGTGSEAPIYVIGNSDEEMRKRITSILLAARVSAIFDNAPGKLDSAALAAALTSDAWEDRALSTNSVLRLTNRTVWVATANGAQLSPELARRTISIQLDARVDRPFERDNFKHVDLLSWTRENRGRLLAAAAILVRAWICAGRPKPDKTLASFEAWSFVVGGILKNAGIDGWLENRENLLERADGETQAWRSFTDVWCEEFGTRSVSTNDLLPLLDRGIGLDVGNDGLRSQQTKLGGLLSKNDRRVFGHHQIERGKLVSGRQRWALVMIEAGGPVGPGGLPTTHACAKRDAYVETHSERLTTSTRSIDDCNGLPHAIEIAAKNGAPAVCAEPRIAL